MRRFDHEYAALKQMIAGGELGNPLMLHCTHRNPAVPDLFDSEFMIRDSVVHEVDSARFLLDEEIIAVQRGQAAGPTGERPGRGVRPDAGALRDRVRRASSPTRSSSGPGSRTRSAPRSSASAAGASSAWTRTCVSSAAGRDAGAAPITPGLRRALRAGLRRPDAALGRRGAPGRRHGRRPVDGPGSWDGYAAVAVCEAGVAAVGRRASASRPGWSTPGHAERRGSRHEARARRPDVPPHPRGDRAARHRGPRRLRVDGALPEGGLHPVLQAPPGRRADGRRSCGGAPPTPASASPRCCRCCAGRGRTRTSARPRSAPGSGPSRSPSTSAST